MAHGRVPDKAMIEKVDKLRNTPSAPMVHSSTEIRVPNNDGVLFQRLDEIYGRYQLFWGHNRFWFELALLDADFVKQKDSGKDYRVWIKQN